MREQSSELFSCRTVDEVSIHRSGEEGIPHISSLPCHGRKPKWLFRLEYRPVRRRQRDDLVMLAHMRTAWSLGRHRIARLIRENAMQARQKRRFRKPQTVIMHFRSRPIFSRRISRQQVPIRNGMLTFLIFGRKKGGCISLASLVSLHVVLSDGPSVTACIASWLFRLSRKPSQ